MTPSRLRLVSASDLQWLGGALALSCFPHLLEQPLWLALSLAAILLLLTRLSADQRARLPRYSHLMLGAVVAVLVFQAYHTLVGREGGVAILMALSIVKLLETRTLRDVRALLLLIFLLSGMALLHGQAPWQAAYALLSTLAALYVAQRIELDSTLPMGINLKISSRMILEGIPIAILLFVLFPRLPAPLWAIPDHLSAKTGLSGDQMTPGSIGNMIQDESVAFRVSFKDQAPSQAQMYWRGPVFEDFDGISWQPAYGRNSDQNTLRFQAVPQIIGEGEIYSYSVTLEPHQQSWLLALDMPTQIPANANLSNRLQIVSNQVVSEKKRIALSAQLSWRTVNDSPHQIERSLLLPADLNPKSRALALGWAHLPPRQRVAAALNWLRNNDFSYTLSPPILSSRHRVDEFLFTHRQGFCEHYASAFTFLMRAAGVPARVVTGYQGAQQNADYWIVRQADAHAWTEVWYADQGWQRVDPTFVIAPSRITAGIGLSIDSSELPFMMRQDNAWLRTLRLKADVLVHGWNQWVVGYDQKRQNELLKKLGIDDFLSSAFLLWLMGGLLTILGGFAAWLLYKNQPPRPDAASRLFRRFLRKLAPLDKAASETAQAFAARAQAQYPHLTQHIKAITHLYLNARYGNDPAALQALEQAVRQMPRARQP
ncbi:DUF3488 and transglutaminase-like domain-containing protein [Chitinibacter sp. FCG-7]|uniref:DUF3488 and transglutaminase-like domain-containing protein n=1 Tax=Chitinibacter mangrovi TaxID=3153927 RepID=A0AAU7FBZ0_9NEIS